MIKKNRLFSSLTNYPHWGMFWGATLLAHTSRWMETIAQGWLVYQITDSPILLALVSTVQTLPRLLGPYVGVVTDRSNRKRLLLFETGIHSLLTFLLVGLLWLEMIQVWHIVITSLGIGLCLAFDMTPRRKFILDLVDKGDDLSNAITLNVLAQNITALAGPALAGFLMASYGMLTTFSIAFSISIINLTILFGIKAKSTVILRKNESIWRGLVDGINYSRKNQPVYGMLLLTVSVLATGTSYRTFMPVFARDLLKVGPIGLGYLNTASALGSTFTTIIIASIKKTKHRGLGMIVGAGIQGVLVTSFAFSRSYLLSLFILFTIGIMQGLWVTNQNSIMLTAPREDMVGRVIGLQQLSVSVSPLGTMFTGALANTYGVPSAVIIGGIITALTVLIIGVTLKNFRGFN